MSEISEEEMKQCMADGKHTKEECEQMMKEKGNLTLEQRIMNVMKDVFDQKIIALEKAIDAKIDALIKTKEVEMEQALRKGFGLETDATLHQSDIPALMRKAALEIADSQKRTPIAEKAGPEGNKSPVKDPYDETLKQKLGGAT